MSTDLGGKNDSHQSPYENAVFVSYKWGDEGDEIVNQIEQVLQKRGIKLIRDKRDLGYKGSIRKFMERIGRGNCVIVVINDAYLRSRHCMFELMEIAEGKQFHKRVFPIVLGDAGIYDPLLASKYVKHWEDQRAKLVEAMKDLDPANLQGIRDDIDLYDDIRDEISNLINTLKDMNTLTLEEHQQGDYTVLVNAIERKQSKRAAGVRLRLPPGCSAVVLWGFIGTILAAVLAALITTFGSFLVEVINRTPVSSPNPLACVTADDVLVRLHVSKGLLSIGSYVPSESINLEPDQTVELKVEFKSVSGQLIPVLDCGWDNANTENITSSTEGKLLYTAGCTVDYKSGHTKITDTLSLQVSQESCPGLLSYAFFIFPINK
jgi:hypothetical protein